ncbi:hypothetical protein PFISCL1PPCAC_3652, partial [Pristionchus fissidentatus]
LESDRPSRSHQLAVVVKDERFGTTLLVHPRHVLVDAVALEVDKLASSALQLVHRVQVDMHAHPLATRVSVRLPDRELLAAEVARDRL